MTRRGLVTVAVVASTSVATLASLAPVSRFLSKVGDHPDLKLWSVAKGLFWKQSLPSLVVGVALAAAGASLIERRPLLGVLLLVAAPIAVIATNFLQLALS